MSITPEVLKLLQSKGLTLQDAIEIAEAMTPARTAGAERQARYRQRKKTNKSKDIQSDNVTGDVTRNVTPPNDIYSNPPASPSLAKANGVPQFAERLVEAWNAEPGLRPARKLTGQRLTKLRRRIAETGEADLLDAVKRLGASPFHCGKNDRGWVVDLGWLIRNDENVNKALELDAPGSRKAANDPGGGFLAHTIRKMQARDGP